MALIAGPTASGKSALAVTLAERTNGVVVNADSAQVYRDLEILTARPSPSDLARAEHRLFGTRDAALPCSAAEWATEARKVIAEVHCAGRLPILVGGTGLYLRTLLEGIAPVPPIDERTREAVRAAPIELNYQRLLEADPDRALRLRPTDTTRIARALEVVLSTGRTLSAWQEERTGGIADEVALQPLILLPPRAWLYERCECRFAAMLAGGAIAEVEALLARRLDPDLPAMRAIGVREIALLLQGNTDLPTALAAGQQATRRYAKRQYTWFAHQPPAAWPRFTQPLASTEATERALALMSTAD